MDLTKPFRVTLLTLAILIVGHITTSKSSFIGYSWPPKVVNKCIQNTSVFFVEYPSGGIIGSGVVVSKDGKVLTAAHLFTHGDYSKIQMVMINGNEYDMKVLLINPRIDLALVEPIASAQDFPFANVQKDDHVEIGQDVLVVGHPYAGYWTVTSGIVSKVTWSLYYFGFLIETDALVNPGNSGGPMFNTKGEVVGTISAMRMSILGRTGIGLAVHVKELNSFLRLYESQKSKNTQRKRYKLGEVK